MSYVPIVPTPVQSPQASPRARQLSVELERVIEDFQKSYPDTRPGDVRDAMRLAWGGASADSRARARSLVAALLGGTMLAGGLVMFYISRNGGFSTGGSGVPWIAVMIGLIAVMGIGAFFLKRD